MSKVRKKTSKSGDNPMRLTREGKLRIPPVAIAFFFNSSKQLKIVFPVTGEHPDVTIKRVIGRSGIVPGPFNVHVTKNYFQIVRGLPSSVTDLVNNKVRKNDSEKSIFDAESVDQSVEDGRSTNE